MISRLLLSCLSLIFLLASCITPEEVGSSPRETLHSLWRIIDEHYCFFDYKRAAYGLDWQEVGRRYEQQVSDSMSEGALFEVLGNMCAELRDGHVNLSSSVDVARYAKWYEDFPTNYSDSLERITLGRAHEHKVTTGLRYRILPQNIGYVRCASLAQPIGTGNWSSVLHYFKLCDGLIIDIRSNGGGLLTAAETLASAFINEPTTMAFLAYKTGPGHQAFSTPRPLRIEPLHGLRWQKPVVVLTNRRTYSAANALVMFLKGLPNVTIVGDKTGGGSGLPFSSELPNGWSIRFSASPMFTRELQQTELGIDPDVHVDITPSDYARSVDTILQRAIALLQEKAQTRSQTQRSKVL